MISLNIKHDSGFPLRRGILGSLDAEVGDLLDKGAGGKGVCDPIQS
jgi:hypothetical protein